MGKSGGKQFIVLLSALLLAPALSANPENKPTSNALSACKVTFAQLPVLQPAPELDSSDPHSKPAAVADLHALPSLNADPPTAPSSIAHSPDSVPKAERAPPAVRSLDPPALSTQPPVALLSPPHSTVPEKYAVWVFQSSRPCVGTPAEILAKAKWEFRNSDVADITEEVGGVKMVRAQDPTGPLQGVSCTAKPLESGLKGCFVRLPPGKPLPAGWVMVRDGKDVLPTFSQPDGHVTVAPTQAMPRSQVKRQWEAWIGEVLSSPNVERGFIPPEDAANG